MDGAIEYLGLDKKGPAHVGYDDLKWERVDDHWEEAVVDLNKGDSAWNPASTKHVIYGPATVRYQRSRAQIVAHVGDLRTAEQRLSENPLFVAAERDVMENG